MEKGSQFKKVKNSSYKKNGFLVTKKNNLFETPLKGSLPSGEIKIRGKFNNFTFQASDDSGYVVMNVKVEDILSCDSEILQKYRPKLGSLVKVVGNIPYEDLKRDIPVEVLGVYEHDSKWGYQINIDSFIVSDPVDEKGIEFYLSSGFIKWIGPKTAKKIVRQFGVQTLNILDNDPAQLLKVPGLGAKMSEKIIDKWQEQRSTSRLMEELVRLQISPKFARKALQIFGETAAQKIRENPYLLMQIGGISFKKADKIARLQKFDAEHPERIKAGLIFATEEAAGAEGHCYLPEEELIKRAASDKILNVAASKVKDVLLPMPEELDLFSVPEDKTNQVYQIFDQMLTVINKKYYKTEIYTAERYVASSIQTLRHGKPHWKIIPEIVNSILKSHPQCSFLTDEQKNAVVTSLNSKLSVITGLPGVGKTTTVKAILTVLDSLDAKYVLAAPTGKAAKRLTEQTGEEAKTLHRLLEAGRDGFKRDSKNPIDTDFVIVDEVSMLDVSLASFFFNAIKGNTCVILIGDPNQLPSVGPGNILRDIIGLRLCNISELTKIQRQAEASPIIRVAHAIYQGKKVDSIQQGKDFTFIECEDGDIARKRIVELIVARTHCTPQDIQVLAPMWKGKCGVSELNNAIKEALKEQGSTFVQSKGFSVKHFNDEEMELISDYTSFHYGDKVIQTSNNYDKQVFNGEVGHVVGFDIVNRTMTVLFDDKTVIYEDDECSQLQLAFAMTIHKSQGSEFTYVIIPILYEHYIMLYRNLLYTAVTRAKQHLVLVGTQKALNTAIRNNKPIKRWTDLSV